MVHTGQGKQGKKNERVGKTETRETSEERCGVPGSAANETGKVSFTLGERECDIAFANWVQNL